MSKGPAGMTGGALPRADGGIRTRIKNSRGGYLLP